MARGVETLAVSDLGTVFVRRTDDRCCRQHAHDTLLPPSVAITYHLTGNR